MGKILFDVFVERFIEVELKKNIGNKEYSNIILEFFLKALIYVINEQRILKNLKAKTPELRYEEFNKKFKRDINFYYDFKERYKEIFYRCKRKIYQIEELKKEVKERFYLDMNQLLNIGLLSRVVSHKDIKLEIKGDIHNNVAVCVVDTGYDMVVYKPRSASSFKLVEKISFYLNHNNPYTNRSVFSSIKYLDKGTYYWEKFINENIFCCEVDIKGYYYSLGAILFVSYILNISDLHFENILINEFNPVLVDLETVFSLSPFEVNANNEATKDIILKSINSVLSTGMLPVSSSFKHFGGDTSGILGGKYIIEEIFIDNEYRDDIRLVRRKKTVENYGNIPFKINEKKEKEIVNPTIYLEEIKEGFRCTFDVFRNNREKILDFIKNFDDDLRIRILYRNTKDYSLIIRLFSSPLYCNNKKKLISKLKISKNRFIQKSEEKQLLEGFIPYFYTTLRGGNVFDVYGDKVDILREIPIDVVLNKIINLNEKNIMEEENVIDFSFKSQELFYNKNIKNKFFYDESMTKKYNYDEIIDKGIANLQDIIYENAKISIVDNSINWESIGVGDNDQIELKPLDYSLYNGISGVGYSIAQVYKYTNNPKAYKFMKYLYNTCLKYINHNLGKDYSYYNGSLGILEFLCISSRYCGNKEEVINLINKYVQEIEINKIKNLDVIAGISGIGISLVKETNKTSVINKIIFKIFEILKQEIELNQNYLANKTLTDNISFAHGHVGVAVFFYYYVYTLDSQSYKLFMNIINKINVEKIDVGWIDKRNNEQKSSAHWCHGSTGVLIAMIEILKADRKNKKLNNDDLIIINDNMIHAVTGILNVGLEIENYSLCHGISGNLISLLLFISSKIDFKVYNKKEIEYKIKLIVSSMIIKGLNNNWYSGYGTKFNSYGLFNGLSGILYFLILYRYEKDISKENILMPYAIRR